MTTNKSITTSPVSGESAPLDEPRNPGGYRIDLSPPWAQSSAYCSAANT